MFPAIVIKKIEPFRLKIVIFTAIFIRSIIHRHVIVMSIIKRSFSDPTNSVTCLDTGLSMGLTKQRNEGQFLTGAVTGKLIHRICGS